MAFNLKIVPGADLLLLAYSGQLSTSDFEATLVAVAAAPGYRSDFDDITFLAPEADFSNVGFELVRNSSHNYVEALPASPGSPKRVAFVCANEMQRAMSRVFAAYVKANSPASVTVETFNDLASAIDWIESAKGLTRKLDRAQIIRLARELGQDWCCANVAAA